MKRNISVKPEIHSDSGSHYKDHKLFNFSFEGFSTDEVILK